MKLKKLFLTLCLSFLIGISYVNASNKIIITESEYTEEFKAYMNLSNKEKSKYILPAIYKSNFSNEVSSVKSSMGSISDSKFDLRDKNKITGVKDQEQTNTCWAFSALASVESNYMVNSGASTNLSVSHMELSTQNKFPLPYLSFKRNLNAGGNGFVAAPYFLNHRGPVLETELPFSVVNNLISTSATTYDMNNVTNKKAALDVDKASLIMGSSCSKTDPSTNEIKEYLINNGALMAQMNFDISNMKAVSKNSDGSYNLASDSFTGPYYYYSGSDNPNHGVTIIGWDDTISKDLFREGNRPSSDGAWIIKNSYGSSIQGAVDGTPSTLKMGDNGYYYVSYEDKRICTALFGFSGVDNTMDNKHYYHDELGASGAFHLPSDVYTGARFNKRSTGEEKITKITFPIAVAGTNYTVYYADNGGFNNLKQIASGTAKYAGYETVKPSTNINVSNNFSIVIKHNKMSDGEAYFMTSIKSSGGSFWDNNQIISDVTYLSIDGKEWADTAESGMNASIRVYTSNSSGNSDSSDTNPGDNNDDQKPTTTTTTKSTTTTTTKRVTTTTSNNESTSPSDNENEVNDDSTIIVKPNEKNEGTYTDNSPSNYNPDTSDTNIVVIGIIILVAVICIFYGKKKIKKLEGKH